MNTNIPLISILVSAFLTFAIYSCSEVRTISVSSKTKTLYEAIAAASQDRTYKSILSHPSSQSIN